MNEPQSPDDPMQGISAEDFYAALFVNLIMQQSNMAVIFLGKTPHPETGEVVQDLETAKFFIDQLEMLEIKTRGNLGKKEEQVLKQNLTMLRMAFVEVSAESERTGGTSGGPGQIQTSPGLEPRASEPSKPSPNPAASTVVPEPTATPESAPEESRKKFTKKY